MTEEQEQSGSEWIGSFNDHEVKRFVEGYLDNKTRGENDDPISHMAHFVQIALDIPGVVTINPVLADDEVLIEGKPWLQFVRFAASYLHAINPSFSKGDWAQLFYAVLVRLHGGTFLRIRKRPKLAKLQDANFMSVPRLMEKYRISRRHAFNLRKEAYESRTKAARKK